ncbi:phase variable surface lipoprotein [Candidatus Phytoplasma australasiaticum]|uniref:Phase variable surface lipoprotein n=1 Tax=Candidatus Phytoplasma australasiaticum subsp. australasiaticum TaxID=2832407 RepID=A0AAP5CPT7_9MOLU|nr:phase variable surface lipoprotein [Candidatus Phytoplasma australasiaticum]MDO8054751.1 phase variable surface lipoprotein [Candidatus Phytoplasma australasiaticum]MDO8058956.1 phase variable surface lipoprotein [Candidatus Phytoplasma australasiaticum]
MKNNTHQEISMGGRNNQTTPNDLIPVKNLLISLKTDLINLTIVAHSKKKNTYQEANYRPKNQTLFVDSRILEEIKQLKIALIKDNLSASNSKLLLTDLTPLKSPNNRLQNHYPLFQINYQNEKKNQIKTLIGKIDVNKLANLQLYPLDPNKLDKYHKPIKTNYKKGLNIIYYRQEDLKFIQSFLTKAPQGYRVKKLHPKYKYLPKNKK